MHLSFLFCSIAGAAATQGSGEAGLGGSPVSSGKTTPPAPPQSHLHCCSQARAFAFTQLSALNINKQRGLAFPLYLNTHCHSQWQTHQCWGSCRDLPMFPLCPQRGAATAGAFTPIVFHSFLSPCPPRWTQPLSIEDAALQSRLRGWGGIPLPGLPWAPPGTPPQFPHLPSPGQHCDRP